MQVDLHDSAMRERVYALLDTGFPRLAERIRIARRLGAVWEDVSTAFVAFDGDVAVAHAGVIEIPMVIGGRRRGMAGIHAVCTGPDHRGRGHARAVMEEALRHVDARFDVAMLTTAIPDMYTRFGFRTIEESVFVATLRSDREGKGSGPFPAPLPVREGDADSLRTAARLLAARQPVSMTLASVDPGWLFLIDEVLGSHGLERLHYAPHLDALLAYEIEGGTLRLLDIVAADLPSLGDVLACIDEPFDRVEVHFTPDRLMHGTAQFTARPSDPRDRLMVRGSFDVAGPLKLSPLARC